MSLRDMVLKQFIQYETRTVAELAPLGYTEVQLRRALNALQSKLFLTSTLKNRAAVYRLTHVGREELARLIKYGPRLLHTACA